jgi:hypothetical protein
VHGMIFSELQNYAETKHGPESWNAGFHSDGQLDSKLHLYQSQPGRSIICGRGKPFASPICMSHRQGNPRWGGGLPAGPRRPY